MSVNIESYRSIIGEWSFNRLWKLAKKVGKKRILHVNSTRVGGGVAEILNRMIPLMNELGLNARWEVIEGNEDFYKCTKLFHNNLQGKHIPIEKNLIENYLEVNRKNAKEMDFDADLVIIHDPQPLPLINKRPKNQRWIWRCHIDLSHPVYAYWRFLRPFVNKYEAAIISVPLFGQRLEIPQYIIHPSIDPLSDKNRDLSQKEMKTLLGKIGVVKDKPLFVQVSRFDRFKDPLGVIEAFELVRREMDCKLVLAGNFAADDPEAAEVLGHVQERAGDNPDIQIIIMPEHPDLETNALQKAADIVLQKSVKEGFGLTVTEAMWKAKPVIGGAVGGIRLQIINGINGFTVHSPEGAAYRLLQLLKHKGLQDRLGKKAKEYIREHYLITRHLQDYLMLLLKHN